MELAPRQPGMQGSSPQDGRSTRGAFDPATKRDDVPDAATLLSHLPTACALIQPDGTLLYLSPGAAERLGCRPLDLTERPTSWLALFPVHLRPAMADALTQARGGKAATLLCALADPYSPSAAPKSQWTLVMRPAGNGCVLCDEADTAREESDLRLREVDHRMKNSLATISSLLRIQSRAQSGPETRAALEAASLRVMTIGRVHEQLYRSTVAGGEYVELHHYIGPLVEDLVASLSGGEVHLLCELGPVSVRSAGALGIGLIVTELVMNSLRHAVGPGTEGGLLRVQAFADEDTVNIVIEDSGPGLPDGLTLSGATGIGGRIVELYTRGLNATLDTDRSSTGGARFALRIPG